MAKKPVEEEKNVGNKRYWLGQLDKPVEEGVLSEAERQNIYNLARRQNQGALNTGVETAKEQLGSRGFRAGESGFADSAIGEMIRKNQETMGQVGVGIGKEEAQRRERIAELNLNRLLGAGGIAAQHSGGGGAGKAAMAQLDWEKEKWGQEFPWQQEQARMGQLFDLYGMMGTSQNQVYAPYANAMGQY